MRVEQEAESMKELLDKRLVNATVGRRTTKAASAGVDTAKKL